MIQPQPRTRGHHLQRVAHDRFIGDAPWFGRLDFEDQATLGGIPLEPCTVLARVIIVPTFLINQDKLYPLERSRKPGRQLICVIEEKMDSEFNHQALPCDHDPGFAVDWFQENDFRFVCVVHEADLLVRLDFESPISLPSWSNFPRTAKPSANPFCFRNFASTCGPLVNASASKRNRPSTPLSSASSKSCRQRSSNEIGIQLF